MPPSPMRRAGSPLGGVYRRGQHQPCPGQFHRRPAMACAWACSSRRTAGAPRPPSRSASVPSTLKNASATTTASRPFRAPSASGHWLIQPVIDVAPDGTSAKMRHRLLPHRRGSGIARVLRRHVSQQRREAGEWRLEIRRRGARPAVLQFLRASRTAGRASRAYAAEAASRTETPSSRCGTSRPTCRAAPCRSVIMARCPATPSCGRTSSRCGFPTGIRSAGVCRPSIARTSRRAKRISWWQVHGAESRHATLCLELSAVGTLRAGVDEMMIRFVMCRSVVAVWSARQRSRSARSAGRQGQPATRDASRGSPTRIWPRSSPTTRRRRRWRRMRNLPSRRSRLAIGDGQLWKLTAEGPTTFKIPVPDPIAGHGLYAAAQLEEWLEPVPQVTFDPSR